MSLDLPPEFTLFLDRNASVRLLITALQARRIPFVRHDDIFLQDAPDTVWLAEVGRQ